MTTETLSYDGMTLKRRQDLTEQAKLHLGLIGTGAARFISDLNNIKIDLGDPIVIHPPQVVRSQVIGQRMIEFK